MIPIIYPANETEFKTNGLVRVRDCLSCTISSEANIGQMGAYELEMEIPLESDAVQYLKRWNIILAKANDSDQAQPFDIYSIQKNDTTVKVSARHVIYRLQGLPYAHFCALNVPHTNISTSVNTLNNNMVKDWGSPFGFTAVGNPSGSFYEYNETHPVYDLLNKLISAEEGFNCDVKPDRFAVAIGQLGQNNGVVVRYGKNIESIEYDIDSDDGYNCVWAYFRNDAYMAIPDARPNRLSSSERPYLFAKFEDVSRDYENWPSYSEMARKSNELLPTVSDDGIVTISINAVSLWKSPEYEKYKALEQINLYDTVRLVHQPLGLNTYVRVVKTEYDSLAERYTKIELGNRTQNLADTIASMR